MTGDFDPGARGALQPLDPRVLQVIRSSAARLSELEDAFVRQLYAELAALTPDMPANGQAFCQRMVESLLWAALTDQPLAAVAGTLRRVGTRNWLEGFSGAIYGDVAHALVRAVRNLSGEAQSTSTGSAWVSFFLWIEPLLIAGARQAAAERAAAQQADAEQAEARREAAQREAARALARDPRASHPRPAGDVDLEMVADLLDDDEEEDDDSGYGQIMLSMTRNQRRHRPQRPG